MDILKKAQLLLRDPRIQSDSGDFLADCIDAISGAPLPIAKILFRVGQSLLSLGDAIFGGSTKDFWKEYTPPRLKDGNLQQNWHLMEKAKKTPFGLFPASIEPIPSKKSITLLMQVVLFRLVLLICQPTFGFATRLNHVLPRTLFFYQTISWKPRLNTLWRFKD